MARVLLVIYFMARVLLVIYFIARVLHVIYFMAKVLLVIYFIARVLHVIYFLARVLHVIFIMARDLLVIYFMAGVLLVIYFLWLEYLLTGKLSATSGEYTERNYKQVQTLLCLSGKESFAFGLAIYCISDAKVQRPISWTKSTLKS
jgi:hypothetical protein